MKSAILKLALAFTSLVLGAVLSAQVPQLINYQGRIAVSEVNFEGEGHFKFALVSGGADLTTYWSNDGTSIVGSEPASPVSLPVTKGLYSVQLGDTTLSNMTAIPATVFTNPDVRLRVWFNDGSTGSQLLTPDQRIAAVGYALMASTLAADPTIAGTVTATAFSGDGSGLSNLSGGSLTAGSVDSTQLASDLTLGGTTYGSFSGDGSALTGITAVPESLAGASMRKVYSSKGAQVEHIKARLAAVNTGTSNHLTVLQLGDSLTQKTSTRLIDEYLTHWFDTDAGDVRAQFWSYGYNVTNWEVGGIGSVDMMLDGAAWKRKSTAYGGDGDYDVSFTGSYFILNSTNGDVSVSQGSTTKAVCDRIIVPYVTEPNSGAFKLQYSADIAAKGDPLHVSWTDPVAGEIVSSHTLTGTELLVDTDGTFDGGVIELDFSSTSGTKGRLYQVVHESGGDVRFLTPAFFVEAESDTVNGFKLGEGSNSFAGATATSVPLMAKLFASIKPDIITTQSDDWASAYSNFLPLLAATISQAALGYEPLVILIGEGPKGRTSYDIPASNNVQAAYAASQGWYFFDLLNIAKNWQTYSDLGYITSDPVHLDANFYLEGANRIAAELGWDQYPVVNAPAYPSAQNIGDGMITVADWKSRITTNSGSLTSASEGIATALAIEIERIGLRSKIKYLLPFLGADLAAMQVPLIDDHGVGNAVANALTDTEVHEAYGMQKSTGTDHYLDTGINNTHATGTDDTIGLYFTGRTSGYPLGVRQNAKDNIGWETNGDIHIYSDTNSQRFATGVYPQTGDDGLHVIMHEAGMIRWYLDGALRGSRGADATPEIPTKSIKIGAMDWFNGTIYETDAAIGFFFHGSALTAQEVADLSAVIESVVIQALGR